jgi:hypothetical protein
VSAQHTPGPWKDGPLFGRETRGVFWTDTSKPGRWQRRVDDKGEFLAADARLIAAAPDLLSALRSIVAECKGPERPYSSDSFLPAQFIEAAQAAIARAEGRL